MTMPPIDRDLQISLMKDAEARLASIVDRYLSVPIVREAARTCAFESTAPGFTSRRVRVPRAG
ncbi:hypothetical protein ASG48_01985 [Aurantimonas sp. Leaf443]|nr:hypothetical protein ASG48_01985 [Aurantimonas sp. Leaf443]